MAAQSLLAKMGMRSAILGTAASLAIAAPLAEGDYSMAAHTDASRIGMYFDRTPGVEKIGVVVMGAEVMSIGAGALQMGSPSASNGALKFYNSTNANTVTMQSGVTSASYTVTLPTAQGAASTFLQNNGSGVLSWVAAPGSGTVTSVGISSTSLSVSGSPVTGAGSITVDLSANSVGNSVLANMATQTIKGRTTVGTGSPEDLTSAQVLGIIGLTNAITGTLTATRVPFASGAAALTDDATMTYSVASGLSVRKINFTGSTSGSASIKVAAVAGSPADLTLPTTSGSAGNFLSTDGAGALSWASGGITGTLVSGRVPFANGTSSLTDSAKMVFSATTGFNVNIGAGGTSTITLGVNAGNTSTTASNTIIIGNGAATLLTSGFSNTLIGVSAAVALTTGISNTYIGTGAAPDASTGDYNTAVGVGAGKFGTGTANTAVGATTGVTGLTGSYNIFLGRDSGSGAATSISNTFIAGADGAFIDNVYFGSGMASASASAYTINGTGGSGTDIAGAALQLAGGRGTGTGVGGAINFQTASVGTTGTSLNALATRFAVTGDGATAWTGIATASAPAVSAANTGRIFYDSTLQKFRYSANGSAYADLVGGGGGGITGTLVSGRVPFADSTSSVTDSAFMTFSTASGFNVNLASSGADNLTLGTTAGKSLTSGARSTLLGVNAGTALTTVSDSTAVGYNALAACTVTGNTAMGSGAADAVTSGAGIVAIGQDALGAGTSGVGNCTAVGSSALTNATGSGNTGLGAGAGLSITSGTNNTHVGFSADAVTGTSSSTIVIGAAANSTASNQMVVGSTTAPINDAYFGRGVVAAAPSTITLNATGGSGTNIGGAALQLAGGRGTGTGVGGSLIFQTAAAGSTGSTLNALVTQLTIDSTGLSTFVGRVVTSASTTTRAGLNLPHGSAPSAPVDGDQWTTSAGLFVRINGVTVGPLAGSSGGITGTLTSGRVPVASGVSTLTDSASLLWSSTNGLSSNYSAGSQNELFGFQAGKSAMSGTNNTYVGNNAGHATTSGSNNVMIGSAVATVCTTGSSSVLIGYNVLGGTITSCTNLVAIGQQASANAATASSDGVFVGYRAGYSSTGAKNIGIGSSACAGAGAGGSGTNNIGIGFSTLSSFTTDVGNIAIGLQALRLQAGATNDGYNVGIGYQTGFFLTTGWGNTLLGTSTGHDGSAGITSGSENICIGHSAGFGIAGTDSNILFIGGSSTTNVGINNTYIGNGRTHASPTSNTFNGTSGSGSNIAGASMTFAGGRGTGTGVGGAIIFRTAKAGSTGSSLNALVTRCSVLQDGGLDWTGIATTSEPAVSAASHGTIFYDSTLQKFRYSANGVAYADLVSSGGITGTLTTGRVPFAASSSSLTDSSGLTYSTANGLSVNKTGNTGAEAIGLNAGVNVTTGQSNALFGLSAGNALTTGNRNHFWGSFAGSNQATSSDNIAVGYSAMIGSGTSANNTGTKNVSLGMNSLFVLTSGSNNICLGYQAGQTITTGSHNIILGVDADVADVTASNQFIAGSATSTINNVYFGKGVSHATPTAYTISGTGGSGTNIAGADLQLAGGPGTGSGAGGSVALRTSTAGGSGSTANAAVTRLMCDGAGNVVIGTAALATNATDGFLNIPSCAGTPTGAPTAYTGRSPIIYDTTNNKLWVYNGSWRGIVLV
jgi:hypothetical protein